MLILPAIDLLNGHAVRLKQGMESTAKTYSAEPEKVASTWQTSGAEIIHVVNLDGAFGREQTNIKAIEKIISAVTIPIELGGGIRSVDQARLWLDLGVHRVIFGTAALTEPEIVAEAVTEFGAEKVVVGIDGRSDKVAIRGWEEQTETSVLSLALKMKETGVTRIIYTDVHRDGELVGPNFKSTDELARKADLRIIASGGFSTLEHFQRLDKLGNPNIEGAIVGTALYEGTLLLQDLTSRFKTTQGSD